jgi:hypothetical protein
MDVNGVLVGVETWTHMKDAPALVMRRRIWEAALSHISTQRSSTMAIPSLVPPLILCEI